MCVRVCRVRVCGLCAMVGLGMSRALGVLDVSSAMDVTALLVLSVVVVVVVFSVVRALVVVVVRA